MKQITGPSLAFLDKRFVNVPGDTMTGPLIITPTADGASILRVNKANGAVVFNVDTINGRVGIGTATPLAKLHIETPTATGIGLILKTTDNNTTENIFEWRKQDNTIAAGMGIGSGFNLSQIWIGRTSAFAISDVAGFFGGITRMVPRSDNATITNAGNIAYVVSNQGLNYSFLSYINVTEVLWTTNQAKPLSFGTNNAPIIIIGSNGGVTIDGVSDTQQLIVQAHATQTANLVEQRQSDGITVDTSFLGGGANFNQQGNDVDHIIGGDTEPNLVRVDAGLDATHFGDWDTNYTAFSKAGIQTFTGTARINWTKITANSVTLVVGTTPASLVTDLQTRFDGNYYHIDEVAGTPGMDLIIDFVNVTAFNWVNVAAYYKGSVPHAGITVQLWNWDSSAWDNFRFYAHHTSVGTLADDINTGDFFVPDDTNYIGTGGSAGQVRVRLLHSANGNAAHDHYIDIVALYH